MQKGVRYSKLLLFFKKLLALHYITEFITRFVITDLFNNKLGKSFRINSMQFYKTFAFKYSIKSNPLRLPINTKELKSDDRFRQGKLGTNN